MNENDRPETRAPHNGETPEKRNVPGEGKSAKGGKRDVDKASLRSGDAHLPSGAAHGEVRALLDQLMDSLDALQEVLALTRGLLERNDRTLTPLRYLDAESFAGPSEEHCADNHLSTGETRRPRADYKTAGAPFGAGRQARGIWRLFRQQTTCN